MSRHEEDMPANPRRGHVMARDDGSFHPTIEVTDAFCHCEDNWRPQMCCSSGKTLPVPRCADIGRPLSNPNYSEVPFPQKTRTLLVRIYVFPKGQPIECDWWGMGLPTRLEHGHTSPRSRVTHTVTLGRPKVSVHALGKLRFDEITGG